MRLRWKKNPRPTGLRRTFSGPRGSKLHDGMIEYARVNALRRGFCCVGWYWVAFGVNTCNEPCAEESEAKAQAMAFVKSKLAEVSEQSK